MVGLPRNPGPLSRTFRHGKVFLSLGTGVIYVSVGATGFEPATSWSRTKRSSQAELRPVVSNFLSHNAL